MKNKIQRPGLRTKFFGSKAFLRGIRKKVKNKMKPQKSFTT